MGLSDPTAVLDAITATVDETCACGCGAALAGSPSAWFATPGCQRRWQADRADRPMRDGGRMAGIGLGYHRDAAGPDGGAPVVSPYDTTGIGLTAAEWGQVRAQAAQDRIDLAGVAVPPGSPYLDLWAEMIVRGQVYLTGGGGQVRPVPMSEELRTRVDLSRTPTLAATLNLPPDTVVEFDTTPLPTGIQAGYITQAFAGLQAGLQMYGEAVAAVIAGVGRTVRWLDEHRLLEPSPPAAAGPDGVRERALWLRRNRNTGPARPVRAPRRIDPRGGAPRR